ncbi:hypothetical protein R5R35_005060 [Gryllus longicercus]|uniref:Uncharacterized protein n=1 Tax=Gryllus longicercus TaxID=2509291 RepID=A0AAN9Z1Q1_9ORTH
MKPCRSSVARVLLQPRRSSVEAQAEAEAATRAAEAAARGSLVSDSPYRRLADDTALPSPRQGAATTGVRGALRWLDRRLLLAEGGEGARPQGPPSRLHASCCVALAAAGAASSACAFYFAARDAALGVGAGRGPPSCLGLPF